MHDECFISNAIIECSDPLCILRLLLIQHYPIKLSLHSTFRFFVSTLSCCFLGSDISFVKASSTTFRISTNTVPRSFVPHKVSSSSTIVAFFTPRSVFFVTGGRRAFPSPFSFTGSPMLFLFAMNDGPSTVPHKSCAVTM